MQLNVDGMQVTNNCCGGANRQPSFGRDAIAEFQFISNRFDATQGRSSGAQVNVITKSGTNTLSGSVSGYFRHDNLNAADFIQNRVLPYSNQQVSTTSGGPIRRDRLHYFFNYEFEREPSTVTHNTPYPSFNIDLTKRPHAAQAEPARGRAAVRRDAPVRIRLPLARLPADRRHPGDGRRRDQPSGQSRSSSTSTPRRCRQR